MSYQPINRSKVADYIGLHEELERAAGELFRAYAEALPDKDDWTVNRAWQNTCGTIMFEYGFIEYSKEVYYSGDSVHYTLTVPMSALYDPDFIAQEVKKWEEYKAKKIVDTQRQEAELVEKSEARQRALYEELKKKYDR